jgi:hypothetical protein
VLEAMFAASQQLQAEAQAYLQNQTMHAESYIERLERPDYYPFMSLPQGTTVTDLPDGGRQFVLPGGIIILVRTDRTVVVICDGRAINVDISLGDNVCFPTGRPTRFMRLARGDDAARASKGCRRTTAHLHWGGTLPCRVRGTASCSPPGTPLPRDDAHLPRRSGLLRVATDGGILVISRKASRASASRCRCVARMARWGSASCRRQSRRVQYLQQEPRAPFAGHRRTRPFQWEHGHYRCGPAVLRSGGGTGDGDGGFR